MKIKFENLLDKMLEKINLKRINEDNKGKVIKFEASTEPIVEDSKSRRGAATDEPIQKNNVSKQGVKILTSMVLLLLLTLSLSSNLKNSSNVTNIEPKDVSSVATSTSVDNMNTINEKKDEELVLATKEVPKKVEEKLVFSVPVSGKIQKMYSTDKVIYSKTLSQWKTHDGLDVASSIGTDVKSIERGVVKKIYNDSFYGKTIIIEHIKGYESQYSNLSEDVYVSIGESVVKGQKIGKVGNTSIGEYLDEPHLHFMLYLNDKSINPTYIYD